MKGTFNMEIHICNIPHMLNSCTEDISGMAQLDSAALSRAYDVLDLLLDLSGNLPTDEEFISSAKAYSTAFEEHSCRLADRYDESVIREEVRKNLEILDAAVHEARFKAAAAASLHEFAKETFQTWQTAGIFARRRALNELRERAGFRLEAHRIGNYVAKTFDLMNEAQAEFARAQQACFKADISYKIKLSNYSGIHEILMKKLTE